MPADALRPYRAKRDFARTPEPPGEPGAESARQDVARAFVVQKHWASRLHYDFRLELDGSMKSWAVPKGPSFDPHDKRMAVQVEDHPIAYNRFEGTIPEGQYGAGKVVIWDEGTWEPLEDPRKGYRAGRLKFALHGVKLRGRWTLVRMKGKEDRQIPWLLIKEKDALARPATEFSVVDEMPDSVVPLRGKQASRAPGRAAALPATLAPQLATLVQAPPADAADWLFELKFDGYRLLARVQGRGVRLFTRKGHDWTARLPHLESALGALGLRAGWLDGEIVVPDARGVPSFQALQNAFDSARTGGIVYYLFDAPWLDGRDLRAEPLALRRALLQQRLQQAGIAEGSGPLRLSEAFEAGPRDLVASACKLGMEGVIGKRRDAPYVAGRSTAWIKLKCMQRQEFVVVGHTEPQGTRAGLGALLLAVHDEARGGVLRYAGKVGTGFDVRTLEGLRAQLDARAAPRCPLAEVPAAAETGRGVHWVRPELIAEVSFAQWTQGGRIRHAVFHGLREDKPPAAITRERAVPLRAAAARKTAAPASAASTVAGLRVTHGERVVDASTGLTKRDVVRYYGLVAPLMLPHLQGRPVSLVRAPQGIGGELFFQKHMEGRIPGVRQLAPRLDPGHAPLLAVDTPEALLGAAQMNVLEFHTWNAHEDRIDRPDRMTFDLDPGEGVAWPAVLQGAELVRVFLAELGLQGWPKTSGGKGLHVVVPLRRLHGWDAVKGFSQAIVQHLARTLPQHFVARSGPKNRVGRIFIDYLRNGFGATTVAAWSARARPGMGVSVPLAWDEVPALSGSAQWTVANIHARLDRGNDPWKDAAPQSLGKAMRRLGFAPGPQGDS